MRLLNSAERVIAWNTGKPYLLLKKINLNWTQNHTSLFAENRTYLFSGNSKKLGFESRGVKFANFQVLRGTIEFCPSILLEMGFLNNVDEADYFLKSNNIEAMEFAVLMGIFNYLNTRL